MAENTSNSSKWSGLGLEFLVVVAGIAITFAGQAVIDYYYQQNEVKATLGLVSDELKDNIRYVQECDSALDVERTAINYLWSNKGRYYECDQDSLWDYCNYPFYIPQLAESHEALELLKNTGVFSKIKDKSLALDIIHAYGDLQLYKESFMHYHDKKLQLSDELTALPLFRALFAAPGNTAASFWDTATKDEHGDYFLRELRNQLKHRAPATELNKSIQEVVDRIDAYCK